MRRLAWALVFGLALFMLVSVAESRGTPLSWEATHENVERYVEQQSWHKESANLCSGPECIINPTNCAWTIDNVWTQTANGGEVLAGTEATNTQCVIDDQELFLHENPRKGTDHCVEVSLTSSKEAMVRVKDGWTKETLTVPGKEVKGLHGKVFWDYGATAFRTPNIPTRELEQIPGSKGFNNVGPPFETFLGGYGREVVYELKVSSTTTQSIGGNWKIQHPFVTDCGL